MARSEPSSPETAVPAMGTGAESVPMSVAPRVTVPPENTASLPASGSSSMAEVALLVSVAPSACVGSPESSVPIPPSPPTRPPSNTLPSVFSMACRVMLPPLPPGSGTCVSLCSGWASPPLTSMSPTRRTASGSGSPEFSPVLGLPAWTATEPPSPPMPFWAAPPRTITPQQLPGPLAVPPRSTSPDATTDRKPPLPPVRSGSPFRSRGGSTPPSTEARSPSPPLRSSSISAGRSAVFRLFGSMKASPP